MESHRKEAMQITIMVVTACTLALGVFAIHGVFSNSNTSPNSAASIEPVWVEDWEQLASKGHRIGPESATVTIVVFNDFTCPACSRLAKKYIPDLQLDYPGQIAMVFRHWPLESHMLAYPAARASECAAEQGRFTAFHDTVFAQQRILGSKSFIEFAREAGVSDLREFEYCMQKTDSVEAITLDINAGQQLGVKGTPSLIINGWLIPGLNPRQLREIVESIIQSNHNEGR